MRIAPFPIYKPANAIDTTNLISYWRLDGNSNDAIASNNGSDTNITYSSANSIYGSGAGFGGTSVIQIADHASLKPAGAWTISLWAKTSVTNQVAGLFQSDAIPAGSIKGITLFQVNTVVYIRIGFGGGAGQYTQVPTTTTNTDGQWHNLIATFHGTASSSLRIYHNGVLQGNINSAVQVYAPTNYVRIGCLNDTGTDVSKFTGSIDEVAFYSDEKDQTWVTNNWQKFLA